MNLSQGYLCRFGDEWMNRWIGINKRRVKKFCPKLPFKGLKVAMIILEKAIQQHDSDTCESTKKIH